MGTIKTIIVDDEARIRRGIERLVRSCGDDWEIIGTFSDGQEVYDALVKDSISFDLLLTDVRMPEMDGLSLVKELKKHFSFLTIFISGYDDFQYLQTAIREGAIDYILKPIDREKFQIQLHDVKQKIFSTQKEQHEKALIQEKASKQEYTEQIQLLSEMIWNEDKDISFLDWTKQFPNGSYSLINLSVEYAFSKTKEFTPEDWKAWILTVEKIIEESVSSLFKNGIRKRWWWRGGKLSYWILLFHGEGNSGSSFLKSIEQILEEVRSLIQRETPFTASVALGNEFFDLSQIVYMKGQIEKMLEFRMIEGSNRIFRADIHRNNTADESKGVSLSVLKTIEHILSAFEQEKREELLQSLQVFFKELDTLPTPAQINKTVQFLLVRIINSVIENNAYNEETVLFSEALQVSKNAANLMQLKDRIKQWVLKVMSEMRTVNNRQQKPVQVAKDWIKNNLHENITIKKIAQQVYMNPNYFCDYFKAQTGETILDYVTTARLEKAKELLEKTDLKVYDISLKVGYQDTKYFSRLFKQWMGQTPTQFREKLFIQSKNISSIE